MRVFQLGDIVQANVVIEDEGIEVARVRDLGHVVSPPEADGWPNVYFERTGRVTICAPCEVKLLGRAETGKHPTEPLEPFNKERANVN